MATAHPPSSWSNPQTCADRAAVPSLPGVWESATVPSSAPHSCACQQLCASPSVCPALPIASAPAPAETQWLWGSRAIAWSSFTQCRGVGLRWGAGIGLGWVHPLLSWAEGNSASSLPCAIGVSLLCSGPAPSLGLLHPTALLPAVGEVSCNKPWSQTWLPCAYLPQCHCTHTGAVKVLGQWRMLRGHHVHGGGMLFGASPL